MVSRVTESNSPQGPTAYPSASIAWTTVAILSLTYMFSFMDRQILVLLVEPIKQDLQITDTQVSLLTGFAFAIVYAVMGIPMGRAADLKVRKHVIIFGVTIWSVLTIYCGFARNFMHLFFARMGVGFGEAALTPTAYSMVADLFSPEKLGRAMSVFVLGGVAAGAALSLLLGGFIIGWVETIGVITLPLIGEIKAWQLVLVIVGFLSLLMVIPLSFIKEPKRHGDVLNGNASEKTDLPFCDVLRYLWDKKSFYGSYIAGISLINLYGYGAGAWFPSYFIRVHEWDAASTGINLGMLYLVPAVIGGLASGWLSDCLYRKGHQTAPLLIITSAAVLSIMVVPVIIYAPLMEIKLTFLVLANLLMVMLAVLLPTVIQMATPNRIRAQASAVYLLIGNLVGIGLGPTAIALITDFVFKDEMAVGDAIAITGVVCFALGAFVLSRAFKPFKEQQQLLLQAG